MADKNTRRHADRMRDRLDDGELVLSVQPVNGPLSSPPSEDAAVGEASIAQSFKRAAPSGRPWLLCVTDRRLLFTWLKAQSSDQAIPRAEVTTLEAAGRRLLATRFTLCFRDGSTLDFTARHRAYEHLAAALHQ